MTAYGSIGDAVIAMNDSAVDYLRKPFDIQHLVSVVERIEHRRSIRNERERASG